MATRHQNQVILVVWPLFGYLDIITWIFLAKRNHVILIHHDPTPLRAQLGHSRPAKRAFSWISSRFHITALCHTRHAAEALWDNSRVKAIIASHPLSVPSTEGPEGAEEAAVRVLGQYKEARTLWPLVAIAASWENLRAPLEIHGRQWPSVDGWFVSDKFLPEQEFDHLIKTAGCIVVPYSNFFQSGVAVRAFESGVPVVAPRHEHIEELFGEDWPGFVQDDEDWPQAVRRVLALDKQTIYDRRHHATKIIDEGWIRVAQENSLGGS
ncbi:hypothetical protein [Rhodococcus sp. 5G237]